MTPDALGAIHDNHSDASQSWDVCELVYVEEGGQRFTLSKEVNKRTKRPDTSKYRVLSSNNNT